MLAGCAEGVLEDAEGADSAIAGSSGGTNEPGTTPAGTIPETCGNGTVEAPEQCDMGEDNTPEGSCTPACRIAECGDGFVRAGEEECDDGNDEDTDNCLSTCRVPECGDGIVQDGVELCDDGNDDDTDDCTRECTLASCGDGELQEGEQCDDGNDDDTDDCLSTCVQASCGDAVVRAGAEECDDGNAIETDACRNDCTAAFCGDGVIYQGPEDCDDANDDDTDACLSTCAAASCGDGFLYAAEEQCDDGNTDPGDGCDASCVREAIVYSQAFSQGDVTTNGPECTSFTAFRNELTQAGAPFTFVRLSGTNDMTGTTCMGAQADQICDALGTGSPVSVNCGGATWNVGNCGAGPELTLDAICQCTSNGDSLRPCIANNNPNWGGLGGTTCNAAAQTITLECGF